MKINHLILGAYQTNCYILRSDSGATDCLIIDTGLEAEPLIKFLNDNRLNPAALILTHGHADHITGLGVLRKNWPTIKVYIHKNDAEMLTQAERNLSALTGIHFTTEPADFFVEGADEITEADITLKVIHTPGHTQGGMCLYSKEDSIIFTGDTLFAGSVGRTDFPGGSITQLVSGIKEKLCVLPDETIVLPGHGPDTTIGTEKTSNQYLL